MQIFNRTKKGDTKPAVGLLSNQSFYLDQLWNSLIGLNIGTGDEFVTSGEISILQFIKDDLSRRYEKEPWIFFDVGANHGKYTIEILNTFAKHNIQIHAFEPSKETYEILRLTLKDFTNVKAINLGVSNKETSAKLFTNESGSGMASLTKRDLDYRNIEMSKVEEVKLTTIDNYCNQNRIKKIHFLKLDIEGHELAALEGAKNILREIDYLQFEFGGCNIDTRTFFKDFFMLLNDHFIIKRVLQDGSILIDKYNEIYEQFNTTNFICINRSLK